MTKLRAYYTLPEMSPVYVVAVVCDPRRKFKWFEHHWKDTPELIDQARNILFEFYNQYYHRPGTGKYLQGLTNDFADWPSLLKPDLEALPPKQRAMRNLDELDVYLGKSRIHYNDDVPKWLRDNKDEFPTVTQMAYDVLSIPASSAEVERVFSRCDRKLLILTIVQKKACQIAGIS